LQERVAHAAEQAYKDYAGNVLVWHDVAEAAIRVVLAEAQQAVEALRYESRYMIGGDAEMGESSDWLWRDAALAALAALAEDTSD
jgi:hypothetical protein